MTYEEAIHYWFGRVNFEQKTPQPADLKLDRIRALLERLGNPHDRLRVVHVAGSKGKGSTSAMLASVLEAEGYRTGLFTSPHLVQVEERIQVGRAPISRAELAAALDEVRRAAAAPPALESALTFFEVGTAAGFLHLVRRRVEVAVVEVGLGGQFDSTNVCRPLVSVITSISLDHTQQLGNDLASIAREKAGIIKPGRPTVSGVRAPEARAVIEETCRLRGSPPRRIDTDFSYTHQPAVVTADGTTPARVGVRTWRGEWPDLELGLIGEHQARNAALAVATVEQLRELGLHVGDAAVRRGLRDVSWPARLEVLSRRPLAVLDCAHNVASAQALAQALESSFPAPAGRARKRVLLFAGSRDKDLAGMLAVLVPCFDRIVLTSFRSNQRRVPAEELRELVRADRRADCLVTPDSAAGWRVAWGEAGNDDLICATGSVFLAGELRPLMSEKSTRDRPIVPA